MFDAELRAYAQSAKSFGTTLLIEYGVEINTNSFPWSQEGPGPYKTAYRHIVNLFREEGVTNVRWAFHVDATDNNNGTNGTLGMISLIGLEQVVMETMTREDVLEVLKLSTISLHLFQRPRNLAFSNGAMVMQQIRQEH